MRKIIYMILGTLGMVLGGLGVVLPILPTVPFLLFATFCFGRSSERLDEWFVGTKLYQNNIATYVKGQGMTWLTKIRIMILVTITMTIGFVAMGEVPIARMILVCVWVIHIFYFMVRVKTLENTQLKEKITIRK